MAKTTGNPAATKAVMKAGNSGTKALSTQLNPGMQDLYNTCLALSKSSAIPLSYIGKPDQIFSTVVLGKEFGLAPMTALQNISSINGKPSMSVHLLLGLCMRHPQFSGYRVVKSSDDECVVEMFRIWPNQKEAFRYEGKFTYAEALKANIVKPGGAWVTWRRNMLKARAIAFACREAFADVLTGTYTLEEMDSEKYVDSYMDKDLQAVDAMEAGELNGKLPEADGEPAVRKPVTPPKKVPNKIVPKK